MKPNSRMEAAICATCASEWVDVRPTERGSVAGFPGRLDQDVSELRVQLEALGDKLLRFLMEAALLLAAVDHLPVVRLGPTGPGDRRATTVL